MAVELGIRSSFELKGAPGAWRRGAAGAGPLTPDAPPSAQKLQPIRLESITGGRDAPLGAHGFDAVVA